MSLYGKVFLPTVMALTSLVQAQSVCDIQLQCRANFTGAFNLPDAAFFTNNTPSINDAGDVAIYISTIAGTDAKMVWYGGDGAGQIVYTSPDGASLSDVSLNNSGFIAFPQSFASPTGVIGVDGPTSVASTLVLPGAPFGATSFSSVRLDDLGRVGFRASIASIGNAYITSDNGSQAQHAVEAGVNPASPYSFLFTPAMNENRQIAAKVRLGAAGQTGNSQPDQVLIFNEDGSSVLIAEDTDSNPGSDYTSFDNTVAVNDVGHVAFIANLAAGGRAVVLTDGTTDTIIASTNDPDISDIEFFHPVMNNIGEVAFRAKDGTGLRAVWVGDGTTLEVVAREHDLVETDLGTARIDQHDSNPVFGGNVSINDNGDIAFHCGLTPPDNNQIEWGSGVFVATRSCACYADCDTNGTLNVFDYICFGNAYAMNEPYADCDGSGSLNVFDYICFGNAFATGCP